MGQDTDKRHGLVGEKDPRTGLLQFRVANVMNKSWRERLPRSRIFEWVLKDKQEFSGWRWEWGKTMLRQGARLRGRKGVW